MSISFNSNVLSSGQKCFGFEINTSTNPLNNENNDENKKAYLKNPLQFGGFNLGTGTQQTDASAIQACGNSLNFYA